MAHILVQFIGLFEARRNGNRVGWTVWLNFYLYYIPNRFHPKISSIFMFSISILGVEISVKIELLDQIDLIQLIDRLIDLVRSEIS